MSFGLTSRFMPGALATLGQPPPLKYRQKYGCWSLLFLSSPTWFAGFAEILLGKKL